ncbi:putative nuclear pore associated protein [Gregarina niphandrodes]|uniref:Nuclear pore associated protein n=1 Tax=Gregarina niphandrodes TaxID=110365 RepID=A0A023BAD8_GRENI|nr:putative nuclear pore associated protein [Gregarina niphandrodes]EZG78230.1 putative nuclear pore associated protein [Gregarina niphandrodes]|eukprot:XP_011129398.1 putative nuclear pore associated protein [Gregarina niphandrodes]
MGDSRLLANWKIGTGTEIHVFTQSEPSLKTAAAPVVVPETAPVVAPVAVKKARQKGQSHKYKTFEEYVDEIDFNVSQLALSHSYKPVKRNPVGPTKLPPSISLKHQVYRHVDHVEVMNVAELADFVREWRRSDMLVQRCGYLIGYYAADAHYGPSGTRAVVEAVYEPEQVGNMDGVEILGNPETDELVVRVSKALGLEVVGWVFTHLGRDKLVTGPEVISMGRLQLAHAQENVHYTGYPVSTFVTLTISPKESLKGEPGSDAFMISDLGLALVRDGVLDEQTFPEDGKYCKIRTPDKDELMPTLLETTKETQQMDTDWLLVRLAESAPKQTRSFIKRTQFPKTNRGPATFNDVQTFLNSSLPPHEKLADLHFLVFIAQSLGFESAEQIINAIKTKTDIAQDYYVLLNSLAS